jgi:hypothetical protein
VYPASGETEESITEKLDVLEQEPEKDEDIDFDELEKMLESDGELELAGEAGQPGEEPDSPAVGDIEYSELEKALGADETAETLKTGSSDEKEAKPEEELDFDELEKALGMDEDLDMEEMPKLADEKSGLKITEDIGLPEIEKALEMDESLVDKKGSDAEELVFDELDKMFGKDEEQPEGGIQETEGKGPAAQGVGDLDFSELEKALETDEPSEPAVVAKGGKEAAPGGEDLDLSDFDKLFEEEKAPGTELQARKEEKEPEFFETEDIDFSDLEKMLETGEIKLDEIKGEKKTGKAAREEAFDLSELETAIDKSGVEEIEEIEEAPEELKLDFEPGKEEILSKIEDVEELDFSDLEDMTFPEKEVKEPGKMEEEAEEIVFDFDTEEESAEIKSEKVEVPDIDLSELDKIISGADELEKESLPEKGAEELELDFDLETAAVEEPAVEEEVKAARDTEELDFSDLDNLLGEEKPGGEKAQELELDLEPAAAETADRADDVTELDFSDVDKMLEMEGAPEQKESEGEVFELQLGKDESAEATQAEEMADTLISDEMGFKISPEEPEHEDVHKHLGEFEIDKFQETREMGAKKVAAAVAEEEEKDKKEIKKVKKPVKAKKPAGRLALVMGIVAALLIGAGAFVFYNPFGIDIPYVSDLLGSKADQKGNLKITPLSETITGDYIDTKFGTLFIVKGSVKNDYKHPRSYIKVAGKLFAKGKKLVKSESVFCGNIIPEQDLANLDPAALKKRLLNRTGDKNSNIKVKPGGVIPFVVIFENPTFELDEFTVEAESSVKE